MKTHSSDSHKPLRVLWLSHVLPWPAKGGLQQRSYNLLRQVGLRHRLSLVSFFQRAHQPTLESIVEAKQELNRYCDLAAVLPLPQDTLRGGQARLALTSLLSPSPFTIQWGYCPEYARTVRKVVAVFEPDIVHFDTISLAPYLADIGDVPAVLNHHNIESHMLLRRSELETNALRKAYFWQEGRRLKRFESQTAERFKAHFVCSDVDQLRLRAMADRVPIHIVPNGVDLQYFATSIRGEIQPRSVVFVGGLSWYPNSDAMQFFIREAWPALRRLHPDAQMNIAGRSPSASLQRDIATTPGVELLGFVDDIRPLVHRSAVYACPIRDGGGTKLKMLDAMALGKAIVAHPVACEGLGVAHEEQVLVAETGADMAKCISRLFMDATLRERIAARARAHVERYFSFDSIGADLAALLETYAR